MALTDFEKECIDDIYAASIPTSGRKPTSEQSANISIIKHGSEAERQALISSYINDTGLTKVAADITACDDQAASIATMKTTLQAKETAMQAYVA